MTVTFDGVVLADGESRTATVASGLAPSGVLGLEVLEFLRADWATPVARGNRVVTLPLVIALPPAESFGAALLQSMMFFSVLPAEGALVIEHAGYRITCAQAVCAACKQQGSIEGISNAIALQFTCGVLTSAILLLDQDGIILQDQDGIDLEL